MTTAETLIYKIFAEFLNEQKKSWPQISMQSHFNFCAHFIFGFVDTIGKVAASGARDPQFESSHRQFSL